MIKKSDPTRDQTKIKNTARKPRKKIEAPNVEQVAEKLMNHPGDDIKLLQYVAKKTPQWKTQLADEMRVVASVARRAGRPVYALTACIQLPHHDIVDVVGPITRPLDPRRLALMDPRLLQQATLYVPGWASHIEAIALAEDPEHRPTFRLGCFRVPDGTRDLPAWNAKLRPIEHCTPWLGALNVAYDGLAQIEVARACQTNSERDKWRLLPKRSKSALIEIDYENSETRVRIDTDRQHSLTFGRVRSQWYLTGVSHALIRIAENEDLIPGPFSTKSKIPLVTIEWASLLSTIPGKNPVPTPADVIKAAMNVSASPDMDALRTAIFDSPVPSFLNFSAREKTIFKAALGKQPAKPKKAWIT